MARIKNEQEYADKKQKILNDAMILLAEIGFEKFSINKVIASSGLTKGAFFHYYKSKKELLDGVINEILTPMIEQFDQITDNVSLNAKEKFVKLFSAAASIKMKDEKSMSLLVNLLYKQENQLVLHDISKEMLEMNLPLYEKLIKEGNADGSFNIENVHGVAFMILNMVISINQELGKTLYGVDVSSEKWKNLYDKMLQFEAFTKDVLELDDTIHLYSEQLYEIIKGNI